MNLEERISTLEHNQIALSSLETRVTTNEMQVGNHESRIKRLESIVNNLNEKLVNKALGA